ncbi:MAG TPA: hypothetical protein VFO05_02940 [Candidatus Limnocylindrales bacterium]|nr:hypothetical protein [Candidatus Limnocylindrales bacterium]
MSPGAVSRRTVVGYVAVAAVFVALAVFSPAIALLVINLAS